MKDAVKTLYNHWSNVSEPTAEEQAAFDAIHDLLGDRVIEEPAFSAITNYSNIVQYQAFREGVLTALSLLHPLAEEGDIK